MADVNRGDRPLSPHLQVYRPQITSMTSILHRATGVALLFSVVLVVWWLMAAATSAEAFAAADSFLGGPIGGLALLGSVLGLAYHTLNGIRHLIWDAGYGFELGVASRTGWAAIIGAIAITVVVAAAAAI